MRVPILYDMLECNQEAYYADSDTAIKLFKKLSINLDKVEPYRIGVRSLTPKQVQSSTKAIEEISLNNYVAAIREVFNFLYNNQDNQHEITNPEWLALKLIVIAALGGDD